MAQSVAECKPSIEAARKHVELLTGSPDTEMHFRFLGPKNSELKPFNRFGSIGDIWPEIEAATADKYNIFITVNAGGTKAKDITDVRAIFIDIDGTADIDGFQWHDGIRPDFVVKRGPRHFHAYWRVEAMTPDGFETAQRQLVAHYGSDHQVCDRSRIMRLAGTLHQKAEPVLVKIQANKERLRLPARTAWELLEGLPELPPEPERGSRTATGNPVSLDHLRKLLGLLDPFQPRDAWRDIVAAIRACPVPDDDDESDRLQLALDWSAGRLGTFTDEAGRYDGDGPVYQVFNSMPPREGGVAYGTIYQKAREAGFVGPPARASMRELLAGRVEKIIADAMKLPEPNAANVEAALATLNGEEKGTELHGEVLEPDRGPRIILNRDNPVMSAGWFLSKRFPKKSPDDRHALVFYQDEFHHWCGTHYRRVEAGEVKAAVYDFAAGCVNGNGDPFMPNRAKVEEIISALKAATFCQRNLAPPCWLPANSLNDVLYEPGEMVACRNGILNLKTRRLHPLTPEFFTLNALTFDYKPDAPKPENWLAFLKSIWPDDPESIATLQEVFGYMLSADTRQQKIFFLKGPKRCGKGTIARILTLLLGRENVANPTLASLSNNFGLQPLIGKRAAIVGDARLTRGLNTAVIAERLLSMSGEDALTLDRKYLAAWTGQLGVRMMLLSNELPALDDASGALASRFVLLVMRESFYGREDHELFDRLKGELPGILLWALDGYDRLQRRGRFIMPKASSQDLRLFEDLTSKIGAFIRDCCVIAPDARVPTEDLWSAWKAWCSKSEIHPGSKIEFSRQLSAHQPKCSECRLHIKGKKLRGWAGIGLKQ